MYGNIHIQYISYIALMKLQKPLNPTNISTDRIRAICLPPGDNEDVFMGVKCVATGKLLFSILYFFSSGI